MAKEEFAAKFIREPIKKHLDNWEDENIGIKLKTEVSMSFNFESLGAPGVSISGHNAVNNDGNPTGGYVMALPADWQPREPMKRFFFSINWQDGPLNPETGEGANGACVEDVLKVCRIRLEHFNESKFNCSENDDAISFIVAALARLQDRREKRRESGKLGSYEV